MPFVSKAIKLYNSPEMFAVFLIVTGQRVAYSEYIENPNAFDARADEKIQKVREWYENNREKLDTAPELSSRIRNEIEQ